MTIFFIMIPEDISRFIAEQKVATVCCVKDNMPYCFNCYYAYMEQEGMLVYKSSFGTKHEEILKQNKSVAGTIIPEEIVLATLRGIQYEGTLTESMELSLKASAAYYLKFPFAFAVPGKIYCIELSTIKLTDNAKGFGHKQNWQR